jgi:CHAT domain-containing protein
MFERFTEKAIKVILLAQEEARRLGHNFVGVEFIFLGLIGEATGIAAKVLRQQGITLKNARIEVEKILGRGSGMITVEPPFTESAKLVLNNAVSIARQLEHESINTEHLLIGIIQEGESTARILQNLQVNPQDLAISLIQYFQQQSSNQLPQTVYVLLYNVGTDNEGIHTITDQDKQTILMFESSADATNFARQLRKQNFPVPSVEGMSVEEIISFCEEVGYDWEFVPEGANKIPPIESRESGNTHEEYLNFLMKALNKVYENPDPKYIYPFFEHNLDKLDESLIIILNNWAKNQLASVETEQAIYIADNICNFSTLIQQFSLGNIATNLEIAIAGYQVVLTGFNFDAFPEVWADTQDNLASAYQNRIRGNIAENLELSIAAYTEALKVRTFDKFPKDWADTQNNLANTYAKRIRGDKAENLELAIAAYTEALKVRTFDNSPEDWATTQHNLALAYSNRIRGDKAENLELSIATCNEALKVRTIDRIPLGWANTKNTLAGDYADRIKGDKAENLELAIKLYNEVLQVRTYDKFPWGWAGTQVDLANAYAKRIREDKEDNLEKSINYCQEALRFYTFDTHPQQWAVTKNNLAISYLDRIKENKEDNLELAIAALIESLKVRTFDEFPQQWAITQLNLGCAFHKRIKGDKVENLEKAIECYNNALKILTKDNVPLSCLKTADNLGQLYYKQKQWQLAIESYNIAIEAIENIRLEAFNPQRRQEILADRIEIFHRIVLAHLKLNQPEKALEYIERSKGRNLVELMTQKNLQPQGVDQAIIDKLNELKQKVVNEQIRLQHQSINQNRIQDDSLTPYVQDQSYLKEYQQALDTFIRDEINQFDSKFSLTQNGESIGFKDIQSLTDDETCLLQWYITVEKILAFVVSNDGSINYWESSKNDLDIFLDNFKKYGMLYYSQNGKQEWENQLSNLLQTFADNLHINDILALIPDTCKRLIIIPHYFLHILPIHAFPINENQILQDKYDVQYAPSCQLLQITKQRQLNELTNLFVIQNPTKDLLYTDLEVNIISTLFNQSEIIAKDNATKNAVLPHLKSSDNHCYHFSCHGGFNPDNPLESALFLANKEPLTLGEIFELRLNKCRLVTLSACETGLIDLNSISDEYIGLPSGFLFAGSPSVVSSLWKVNDLQTSFLMIKFYEILFDENQQVSVPVALKQAQYWLQNLTVQEYLNQLNSCQEIVKLMQQKLTTEEFKRLIDMIEDEQIRIKGFELNYKLFNNPFYWAAFTAAGI